jgi:hypothetical protein
VQRFVDVPRAMRVLASLSLLVAFARCSAEGESFDPVEGVEEPASLSVDESEAADPATELELGQLSEPLVSGAPCTAGTVACVSSSVAQRCLNGTVASFVCPAGSACSNGQCVVIQVCRPGATLGCSGNSRVVCNASGTNTIVTACAPGNTCSAGQCVAAQVCSPGALSCTGNSLLTCNSQGTGFLVTECGRRICTGRGCILLQ